MNRALWLLMGLQLRGWGRSFLRNVRTLKGALLIGLGLLVFVPWIISLFLGPMHTPRADPEMIRRFFPLALLLYCCGFLALSRGEGGLNFTQAEVAFLFTGPFTRRQLLTYKICYNVAFSLPSTLLVALFLRPHSNWFLAAYLGIFLSLFFLQQFLMALYLLTQTIGLRAHTVGRKLFVAVVILAVVLAVGQVLVESQATNATEFAVALDDSHVWRIVRTPLLWFANTFLADSWSELALNGGLALLVDAFLVLLVFVFDTQFLEATAARSERIHDQLQRFRRGEAVTMRLSDGPSRVLFQLRPFPHWGGIGPIAWRQVLTALRSLGRLALIAVVMAPVLIGPIAGTLTHQARGSELAWVFAGLVLWMSVILSTMLPFDFRGDLDRMEVLKALPLPAWRIAVGQLLVPIVLLSLIQLLLLAALQVSMRPGDGVLPVLAAFVVPFNGLIFALDNLLFLWFPGRLMATPGDFQAVGRNVFFMFSKMLTLGLTAGLAGGVSGVVFWLTDGLVWPALAAAWVVVVLMGLSLLPLVAFAFRQFDVTRDVPAE